MGNCFGKTKKNRVSPSTVNEDALVPKSRPDSALLFQVSTSPLEELAKQISEGQLFYTYSLQLRNNFSCRLFCYEIYDTKIY